MQSIIKIVHRHTAELQMRKGYPLRLNLDFSPGKVWGYFRWCSLFEGIIYGFPIEIISILKIGIPFFYLIWIFFLVCYKIKNVLN